MSTNNSGNRGRRRQSHRLLTKSSKKPKPPSPLAALLTATFLLLIIVIFPLAISLLPLPVGASAYPTDDDYGSEEKGTPPPPVIAIDFGVTNSRVGVGGGFWRKGEGEVEVEVFGTDDGKGGRKVVVPNWVVFRDGAGGGSGKSGVWEGGGDEGVVGGEDGVYYEGVEVLVGEEAREWASLKGDGDPSAAAVFDVRRLLGRNFSDPEFQREIRHLPFKVTHDCCGSDVPVIEVEIEEDMSILAGEGGQDSSNTTAKRVLRYTPEQITAMIFRELKGIAEREIGEDVTQAVVTIPLAPGLHSYSTDSYTSFPTNYQAAQRFEEAYRTALRHAASLAGLEVIRFVKEPVAAAIAYGLDRDSDGEERTVLVYDLGGTSLDVTVVTVEEGVFEVLGSERVEGWYGGRKMDGNVARWVLKEVAARMGRGGGRGDRDGKVGGHMQSEDIMMLDPKLVRKVKKEVAESVKVALSGQEAVEIDVGELLTNLGGMERNLTMTRRDFEDVNHVLVYDTLSAVGRVLLAANVWWNEVDDVIVVGGSGKIPMVRRVVERYFRRENMTLREGNVDPAEAVVFGAAIQAMVLSGAEFEDCPLGAFDITPIAIGVETAGGVMTRIIHRYTPIPTRRSATFTTSTDNQTTLTLNIFQGNRPFTSSNHLLATIPIDLASFSIAPNLPRGAPRISFTFEIDSNGVLEVFLGDLKDDREPIATIQTSYAGGSSEDPAKWEKIESQIEEAAQFEIEDEETRARLNARRELAGMLNAVRRRLWIVDADDREDVREEAGAVRDALRAAEVWLKEHWDVETNTAEEFVKEKELLSGVVSPILDIVDWVFVDELPPRPPGEGGGSEVGSHDEL